MLVNEFGDSSSASSASRDRRSTGAVVLALVFVACVAIVWSVVDRRLRARRIDEVRERVEQIRDVELRAVEQWAFDLIVDVRYWSEDSVVVDAIVELLDTPTADLIESSAQATVRDRLQGFLELTELSGFFAVGPDGRSLASTRDSNIGTTNLVAADYPDAFAAILDGEVRFTPPQISDVPISADLQQVETMFVGAPVVVDGDVAAIFLLRIVPTIDLEKLSLGDSSDEGPSTLVFSESGLAITGLDDISGLDRINLDGRPAPEVLAVSAVGGNLEQGGATPTDRVEAWALDSDLGIGVLTVYDGDAAFSALRTERRGYAIIAILTAVLGAAFAAGVCQLWARQKEREQLEETRRRLRALVDPSPDAIIRVRRDGTLLGANQAGNQLIDPATRPNSPDGSSWVSLELDQPVMIHDLSEPHPVLVELDARWSQAMRGAEPDVIERLHSIDADGGDSYHRVRFVPLHEREEEVFLLILTDVTAIAERELHLESLASVDTLTGLHNRRAIMERLGLALDGIEHGPSGGGVAVMMVDLDRFKPVNDGFGHAAGDEVLVAVGQELEAVARDQDSVGRIGGDEFVIVCERVLDVEEAEQLAERLALRLNDLVVDLDGTPLAVSASVGVGWTATTVDAAVLVARADRAMMAAKQEQGGRGIAAGR